VGFPENDRQPVLFLPTAANYRQKVPLSIVKKASSQLAQCSGTFKRGTLDKKFPHYVESLAVEQQAAAAQSPHYTQ
jgi:hypothetical protein